MKEQRISSTSAFFFCQNYSGEIIFSPAAAYTTNSHFTDVHLNSKGCTTATKHNSMRWIIKRGQYSSTDSSNTSFHSRFHFFIKTLSSLGPLSYFFLYLSLLVSNTTYFLTQKFYTCPVENLGHIISCSRFSRFVLLRKHGSYRA